MPAHVYSSPPSPVLHTTMSVRKRIKESYEQAKEEVKSLFKAQGDTRPNIPSGAPSYTGSLRADAQNNSPGAPGFERTSPTQVSTSQLGTQPRNVAPNIGNPVEQPLKSNYLVKETHSDAAGPRDANRQMSGGGVVALTENSLPRPQDLGLSDKGVAPATNQVEESVYHTTEDKKPVQVARAVPDTPSIRWKALKQFAGVLEPATNIFGPIKDVVRLFLECVDNCEMAGEAQKEYEALRVRLEAFFEDLRYYFDQDHSLAMTSSMERLCKSIQMELGYIQKQQDRSLGQRYLSAPDETDKILSSYRRIEGHLQRLSLNVNLSMWKVVQEQAADSRSDRMSSRVDRLPYALPAWYDSSEGLQLKRRACTPGTRADAIANILGWARSGAGGGVYWLNGMAGTGKTTIAYSVCAELAAGHQLAASFFCSRLREECRNVNIIIPSIAYQLARFSRPFHLMP
ncbi:unnamed protein product [Rhizoctonia solani]|uniref:Nephrocystin 3-like N-terminal domain-containing protein n=1 Tax=Rhizoctonia solani TaxID=456999 RepID=A0A8H3BR05_9AGAM|nr:unnamed protein product [Rhizoctonia solani]